MGVKGLTTYLSRHADKYLDPFELHDSNLVIDGDNICFMIFKKSEGQNSIFGGNYDHFFRAVVDFFDLLKKCNVTAYVLMDGGYERHKLKTVKQRLKQKINTVRRMRPGDNLEAAPLIMREVFVDAVKYAKVKIMRCLFEADNEIAALARKLNCPVLSNDSDFYIHNVHYIPFVTLTLRVYKKTVEDDKNYEIEIIDKRKPKNKKIVVSEDEKTHTINEIATSYCYLDCCVYTIENLLIHGKIDKEVLPLLAILIGNDYVDRQVFRKFYNSLKRGKIKKKLREGQKRIKVILLWLQEQTVKSAIRTILRDVNHVDRDYLRKELKAAFYGSLYETSEAFEYFGFKSEDCKLSNDGYNIDEIFDDFEQNGGDEPEEQGENENISDGEVEDDEEADDDKIRNDDEDEENITDSEEEDNEAESEVDNHQKNIDNCFPIWFKNIYKKVDVPRFLVDIFYSRLYINYPQVEDINLEDSNLISIPILQLIFTLLITQQNGKPAFSYVTRCPRQIGYYHKQIEALNLSKKLQFDPEKRKNLTIFKFIFAEFENSDLIFNEISRIPENLRLYFLAIIFWLKKCPNTNVIYLHSIILSMLQLNLIDKKIGSRSRDVKAFVRNQEKNLTIFRDDYKKSKNNVEFEPKSLQDVKKMNRELNKNECFLAYEHLIYHFTINEKYSRKHAEFDKTIAHIFAEFQSVVFNFYAITPLLGCPFENVKMQELFNGLLVHNLYNSFKNRSNILEYIQKNILQYSPILFGLHLFYYKFLVNLVPEVLEKSFKVKIRNRKKEKKPKNVPITSEENDCIGDNDDDEEFNDMNNVFSQLLKIQ